jgi:DNA-binding transcriptional ArsR family regulator
VKAAALQVAAALADPTREAIVRLLVERGRSVGEIAERLPVSRPAVSKHLRVLESAGVVGLRAEGTRRLYHVDPAALALLRDELNNLWQRALARFALVANNSAPRKAAVVATASAPRATPRTTTRATARKPSRPRSPSR